uniref:DUF4806 domain-containing protein n=1 Tax=Anopheles minimus TaxID=112268 RepID=A0A182WR42_9DIPT
MPYVLVETSDTVGNKELLAAPATWIQRNEDGTVHLCWPNIRNINMLNALLADERSTPLAAWETHECVIKCSNIQSLSVAGKMIKTLQNHWKTVGSAQKRTIEVNDNLKPGPVCKKPHNNSDNRQQMEAYPNNVHDEALDPDELQVIGMFNELRSMIQSRHEEARKKLHDGFYRVDKSLHSLIGLSQVRELNGEKQEVLPDNAPECTQTTDMVEFYVNPVTCIDEMADFEERLNDEEYRKQVQTWIDCTIDHEIHPENRMRGILDALFEKQFLSNLSWAGKNTEKLAFVEYKNIVHLFKYAGTTADCIATTRYVRQFLVKKLHNAGLWATDKNMPPSLVAIDTISLNDDNNSVLQTVETLNETSVTDDDDSQNSDNSNSGVKPFTCIEELDAFESKLNDGEYRAQMHKWIDKCVAYDINPEARMIEILYLLFDRNFLPKFTWIGAKKDSYGMKKYTNVVQLFQYVGTTSAHSADYMFVANFFNKKLRYASKRADPSTSSH